MYIYTHNIINENVSTYNHTNKITYYKCKQSSYNGVVPKLPMRSMLCGPSSSGKTVLLSNMILDIYRLLFKNLYLESFNKC